MTSAPGTHFVTIRLSALGDLILTTGVLAYWYRTHGWTFSVVTRAGLAPILETHPAVTEILTVSDDQLKPGPWLRFVRGLKTTHGRFPLVDLHGSLRTGILGLLWPGQTFAYPKKSLQRRVFLKTRLDAFGAGLRRTTVPQRYALALESCSPAREDLLPRMFVRDSEHRSVTENFPLLRNGPVIALHPYSTHPAKEWDRRNWLALIEKLEEHNLSWLVLGRNDPPLVAGSSRDLTNRTGLRETAAVLSACTCLVTGDSGPMHMASAVGTPVVALFGPTSREWGFYPCGPGDTVLQEPFSCAPCSLHGKKRCPKEYACMRAVTPDQVLAALADLPGFIHPPA
ncbi:MAG TPA: glycosyltransferase family 9 protein [Desulfomicrobiaceae bacterium]|nr:glycosyltransferase family 9 protein [Desulfomicrobiaceae bacterium]